MRRFHQIYSSPLRKKRKGKVLQHPCAIEIPHFVGFLNYEICTRNVLDARFGESVGILSLCNQQDLSVEPALEFAFPFLEGQSPQHRDVCQSPGDRGKFQLKDCYQSLGP